MTEPIPIVNYLSRVISIHDKQLSVVAGMHLPPDWWSRRYEYAFALDFSEPMQAIADMGTGWMYRPFRDAVAEIVGKAYGVDADPRLLNQPTPDNVELIVAKMENSGIPDKSCDRVFCISVLEDLQDPGPALKEFTRILKDDGLIVITTDMPYDTSRPCPRYPGLNYDSFVKAMDEAGLQYYGPFLHPHDNPKTDALNHPEWNLCVFRAVLQKR